VPGRALSIVLPPKAMGPVDGAAVQQGMWRGGRVCAVPAHGVRRVQGGKEHRDGHPLPARAAICEGWAFACPKIVKLVAHYAPKRRGPALRCKCAVRCKWGAGVGCCLRFAPPLPGGGPIVAPQTGRCKTRGGQRRVAK